METRFLETQSRADLMQMSNRKSPNCKSHIRISGLCLPKAADSMKNRRNPTHLPGFHVERAGNIAESRRSFTGLTPDVALIGEL